MRLSLFLSLISLLNCQPESLVSLGPERVEAAFISVDDLFVDGCESYVRFNTKDSSGTAIYYKPTTATLPVLQQALQTIPAVSTTSERAVTVHFIETGKKVTLHCGWVNKPQLAEIAILGISAR